MIEKIENLLLKADEIHLGYPSNWDDLRNKFHLLLQSLIEVEKSFLFPEINEEYDRMIIRILKSIIIFQYDLAYNKAFDGIAIHYEKMLIIFALKYIKKSKSVQESEEGKSVLRSANYQLKFEIESLEGFM